jgi:hypothetical protein
VEAVNYIPEFRISWPNPEMQEIRPELGEIVGLTATPTYLQSDSASSRDDYRMKGSMTTEISSPNYSAMSYRES